MDEQLEITKIALKDMLICINDHLHELADVQVGDDQWELKKRLIKARHALNDLDYVID